MKKAIVYVFSLLILAASCSKEKEKDAVYTVDAETSKVGWKGYLADGYFNNGTFTVDATTIHVKNGKIERGSFTIPILSVNVLNLQGDLKAQLEAHLKSPDFFNALLHPTATFDITKVSPYHYSGAQGVIEGANALVTGNFTMLGVTKSMSFPARIDLAAETLNAEALFQINRVDWGMTYASDPAAGEHYIKPLVDLHLQLHATRN